MLKVRLLFSLWRHPQRTLLRRLRKVQLSLGACIFLLVHGLTPAYVDAQLHNGLVSYWSFDEGSGTTANDSSGNGNTATLTNGPIWTDTGAIAGALYFDGVDDYVSFACQPQGTISISAWVYAQATSGNLLPRIIDMPGYVLYLAEPGASNPMSLGFISRRATQDGKWTTPANSLAYDSWNHVAVVYDSSSTLNKPDLYINGVNQTISTFTSPQGTQTLNEGTGIIGNRIPLNQGWQGIIDDLRVYNRALSAAEIVSLYDLGNSGPFNFSLSNSMSLSATQGGLQRTRSQRILSLDHLSLFPSQHQAYLREPLPPSHKQIAIRLVPVY
jgi:Concanavalin A-like lectin/glucanases superfamily